MSAEGPILGRPEALSRFPAMDPQLWAAADGLFPVKLTRSFAEGIPAGVVPAEDALARQVLPLAGELGADPGDVPDPVGEGRRRVHPWVVQKHPDRALLLTTRRCHLHCRYCFRRDQYGPEEPSADELAEALALIRASGVRELILSGGDPLTLSDARLFHIIDAVRPEVPILRLHSRAPITAPARITPALIQGLRERAPVWVLVHCNHPRELSPAVDAALAALVDGGLPVLNQSVLLRGVNDDVDVLVALSEELMRRRVYPYYLHHTDAVPGNAPLRVEVERGLALVRELRQRLSGIGAPLYVIDPPDGSGKIPVEEWAARPAGGLRS